MVRPAPASAKIAKLDDEGNVLANVDLSSGVLLFLFCNQEMWYTEVTWAELGKEPGRKRHENVFEDGSRPAKQLCVGDVHRPGLGQDQEQTDIKKEDEVINALYSGQLYRSAR